MLIITFYPIKSNIELFELGKEKTENLDFKEHIIQLTTDMARDLGVSNAADQLKLETAMLQYIPYRRFYHKSLIATSAHYDGPWMKNHDKLAKAVNSWVTVSDKALESFRTLLKSLEIKYHRESMSEQKNVFVGPT